MGDNQQPTYIDIITTKEKDSMIPQTQIKENSELLRDIQICENMSLIKNKCCTATQ